MKLRSRAWLAGLGGLVLLGAIGCGEDNEKNVAGPAAGPVAPPVSAPATQADYGKQMQNQPDQLKKMGYPGAR